MVCAVFYGANVHSSNDTHSKDALAAKHGLENVPQTPLVPAFRSSSCTGHTIRAAFTQANSYRTRTRKMANAPPPPIHKCVSVTF